MKHLKRTLLTGALGTSMLAGGLAFTATPALADGGDVLRALGSVFLGSRYGDRDDGRWRYENRHDDRGRDWNRRWDRDHDDRRDRDHDRDRRDRHEGHHHGDRDHD